MVRLLLLNGQDGNCNIRMNETLSKVLLSGRARRLRNGFLSEIIINVARRHIRRHGDFAPTTFGITRLDWDRLDSSNGVRIREFDMFLWVWSTNRTHSLTSIYVTIAISLHEIHRKELNLNNENASSNDSIELFSSFTWGSLSATTHILKPILNEVGAASLNFSLILLWKLN